MLHEKKRVNIKNTIVTCISVVVFGCSFLTASAATKRSAFLSIEQKIGDQIAIRTVEADSEKLRVRTGDRDEHVAEITLDGRTIVYPFYSSYDSYRIDLIDLTRDFVPEVLLVTGEGRGTSVRKEVLHIFRIQGDKLQPITDTTVSEYFGEGLRWWYEISYFSGSTPRCTDVVLQLKHDDPRNYEGWGGTQLIPSDKQKTISLCK